jgi:hypothetical protein
MPMNPLFLLPLCLLQDPTPAPAPPAAAGQAQVPAPDPRVLFADWARELQAARVLHLVADGILVTADPERPEVNVRWTFTTEVWMAKGGRVNARTTWTGPKPPESQGGEPERYTSLALADGTHVWQGFEGPEPLQRSDLATPRFVPHPLPEVFGLFDGKPGTAPPAAKVGETFDWGEPVRTLPTAIVLDPVEPKTEPAYWYGFAEKKLAGWCTMMPERLGGDVLRGKFRKLEWLERLPEKDPPRFAPEEGAQK